MPSPAPADVAFAEAADRALRHLSVATGFPRWMLVREADPEHPFQVVAALDPTGEIHLGQAIDGSTVILPPVEIRFDVVRPDGSRFGSLVGDGAGPGTRLDRATRETCELISHLLGTLAAVSLERSRDRRTDRTTGLLRPDTTDVDVLTGLSTRSAWDLRLQEEEAVCAQFGETAAVIVVELDGLRRRNSEGGHAAGDSDLRTAGDVVRECIDDTALACRFTGDRLAVALIGHSGSDARSIDAKIRSRLADRGVTSVSAGARRHPDRGLFGALADAVAALDSHAPRDEALPRHSVAQIDEALAIGALSAYFQPVVHLDSGGVEAIRVVARWHTATDVLEPDDFMDAIRATGRSGALFGRLVDAGLHLVARYRPVLPDLQLLVEFEVDDDPSAVEAVLATSTLHGLPPDAVALAITEERAAASSPALRDALTALHDAGVTLVLASGSAEAGDTGGVPFSVVRVAAGADEPTITAAVSSGHAVLAEAVDTQVQRERLRRRGVTFGYGYLFALPQPAEAVAAILEPVFSQRP